MCFIEEGKQREIERIFSKLSENIHKALNFSSAEHRCLTELHSNSYQTLTLKNFSENSSQIFSLIKHITRMLNDFFFLSPQEFFSFFSFSSALYRTDKCFRSRLVSYAAKVFKSIIFLKEFQYEKL